MKVADTSALYATFVANDKHHAQARAFLETAEPFIVPAEILTETLGLLHLRFGPAAARVAAQAIRSIPHAEIRPTPDDVWDDVQGASWTSFLQHKPLSYADAVVAGWAHHRAIGAWTYDQELAKRTKGTARAEA